MITNIPLFADLSASPATLRLGEIAVKALIVYLLGVVLVRIGKSRLLGCATPLDIILAFILGSLLSRGITGSSSFAETTVAAATLVAAHYVLTDLAFRSTKWGWVVKGGATVLVEDGMINWKNMQWSHISEHDLQEEMRLNANVDDVSKVRLAMKERSGQIGVVLKEPTVRVVESEVKEGVQTIRVVIVTERH